MPARRLHILQHVPYEGPGHVVDWALRRGIQVARTRVDLKEEIPSLEDFDALVVLGGPMSIHDHRGHPWLVRERAYIEHALQERVPTLGICLGAQLIAHALGAEVRENAHREIGWHKVHRTLDAAKHPSFRDLPDTFEALHWHTETFAVPDGATALAASEACSDQAFALDNDVLALQFHLELSPKQLEGLIHACPDDLVEGAYVQDPDQMLSDPARFERAHDLLERVLDGWLLERMKA